MNVPRRETVTRGPASTVDESPFREEANRIRESNATKSNGVLNDPTILTSLVESLSARYRSAKPYPYLILEDLFFEDLLDSVVHEMPSPGEANWVRHDDDRLQQFNSRAAVDLGHTTSRLVAFLHSARFLYFLSQVTGIWELLPDPYLQGAGYHVIPRGGKFDVHVDRNMAYSIGLVRRLSLLVYLNKDWKHDYGGQLELWSKDGKRREVSIEPKFNRTALFEITDENYHGVPEVVRCPAGRSRNCFVVYYHTVAVPGNKAVVPHTSLYSPRRYQKKSSRVWQFAKDLTPPLALRVFRKLRPPL
jgi:hypothetical protein